MDKKEEKKPELRNQIWVEPCVSCDCNCKDEDDRDSEKLVFEIPGVPKEKIHLDVVKDRMRLIAHRTDNVDYRSEYEFACPADTDEEPTMIYENGLLTLEFSESCPDLFQNAMHLHL